VLQYQAALQLLQRPLLPPHKASLTGPTQLNAARANAAARHRHISDQRNTKLPNLIYL
jgi:hypothetical protein